MIMQNTFTPLALLYALIMRGRNVLFDAGWLKTRHCEPLVISVGNLTAGGSGKTPFTIFLAGLIQERYPELSISIVSRGYGRIGRGVRNVSDETSLLLGPDVGGDEPVLIARSLPGIPVIVSEKRIEGILLAKRRFRSQIILLDDGFQHRSVFRDLDIVMIDCSLPMRMWAPLPAGIFRESAFDLNRAGLVVLNGETTEWQRYHLRRWVARLTKAPVLEGKLCFSEWKPLFLPPGCRSTPSPDQPSAVITGIARPQRFIHELEQQGFHHLVHFTLRDHSRFRAETCSKLLKSAVSAGARQIVITSKDGVKWSELPSPIPVYVFETAWKPSLTLEPLVNRLDALMGSDHLK